MHAIPRILQCKQAGHHIDCMFFQTITIQIYNSIVFQMCIQVYISTLEFGRHSTLQPGSHIKFCMAKRSVSVVASIDL